MLFRLKYLCSAVNDDGGGGATGAPPATPPAPDGAAASTPAPVNTATSPEVAAQLAALHKEIADMRRENRNRGTSTPAPAPVTPPAASSGPAWTAETTLAFRDSLEAAGLTLPPERRNRLERLARAENVPPDSFVQWAKDEAAALGWKRAEPAAPPPAPPTAQTPPTPAPPPAVRAPDTGAPAGTAAGGNPLPEDFSQIPQSAVDQMTPAQAKAHYDRVMSKRSAAHPFAAAREAAKAGSNPTQALASALQEVLANTRK